MSCSVFKKMETYSLFDPRRKNATRYVHAATDKTSSCIGSEVFTEVAMILWYIILSSPLEVNNI
jgi:hypothetical protein